MFADDLPLLSVYDDDVIAAAVSKDWWNEHYKNLPEYKGFLEETPYRRPKVPVDEETGLLVLPMQYRKDTGTKAARILRKSGYVPCMVQGMKKEPITCAVHSGYLRSLLDKTGLMQHKFLLDFGDEKIPAKPAQLHMDYTDPLSGVEDLTFHRFDPNAVEDNKEVDLTTLSTRKRFVLWQREQKALAVPPPKHKTKQKHQLLPGAKARKSKKPKVVIQFDPPAHLREPFYDLPYPETLEGAARTAEHQALRKASRH